MPSMVVLGRLVTDKLVTSHRRHYKGVCDFPKICWVGKHVSIAAKPTNFRTQGQPNPRKFRLKSGILGHFFPQRFFFFFFSWVGTDFIWETDCTKPNPTKFCANTLLAVASGCTPIATSWSDLVPRPLRQVTGIMTQDKDAAFGRTAETTRLFILCLRTTSRRRRRCYDKNDNCNNILPCVFLSSILLSSFPADDAHLMLR